MLNTFSTLVALALLTMSSTTEAMELKALRADSGHSVQREFVQIWNVRRETVEIGQDRVAQTFLHQLVRKRIELGLSDAPTYSIALLREAQGLAANNKDKEAKILLRYAKDLSPHNLEVRKAFFQFHLWGPLMDLPAALGHLFAIIPKTLFQHEARTRMIFNGASRLYTFSILSLAALSILFLLINFRLVMSFFNALLPTSIPKPLVVLLIATVLFSTSLAFGVVATLPLLLLLLLPATDKTQRILLTCAAGSLFVAISTIYLTRSSIEIHAGPVHALATIADDLNVAQKLNTIQRLPNAIRDLSESRFAVAVGHSVLGNQTRAKRELEALVAEDEKLSKAFINLANIEFREGNRPKAIQHYRSALKADQNSALAYYNLAKIYFDETRLEEANQAIRNANNLSPKLYQRFEEILRTYGQEGEVLLFNAHPEWSDFATSKAIKRRSQNDGIGGLYYTLASLSIFLLLLACTFIDRFQSGYQTCTRCGLVTHSSDALSFHSDLCQQCYNVFIKRVTVDPELKLAKERSIQRYQSRLSFSGQFLGFLFPGAGHIFFGHTLWGGITLFVALLLVSFFLATPLIYSDFSIQTVEVPTLYLTITGFIAVYIVSTLNLLKR